MVEVWDLDPKSLEWERVKHLSADEIEAMHEAWTLVRRGFEIEVSPLIMQHVFGGLLILILVVLRLYIRLKRGAPPLPENEPAVLKFAAHATHWGLYGLLILMPVSGAMAWFGGNLQAAQVHSVLRVVFLVLILLHIGGALFQSFVLKSDVMRRMTRPQTD